MVLAASVHVAPALRGQWTQWTLDTMDTVDTVDSGYWTLDTVDSGYSRRAKLDGVSPLVTGPPRVNHPLGMSHPFETHKFNIIVTHVFHLSAISWTFSFFFTCKYFMCGANS